MTRAERTEWLSSIATQADCLFAEPEDILWIAGVLLLSAAAKLPPDEQQPALNALARLITNPERHVSQH